MRVQVPTMVAGDETAPAAVFGSAPNPHNPRGLAWSYDRGSAGRLKKLTGRELPWFNLYAHEPERWDPVEAKIIARLWSKANERRRWTLVLLGRKVCSAFELESPEWLGWYRSAIHGVMIAVPHPSGLNRWYNDPENTSRAAEVLSAVASGELPRLTKEVK